MEPAPAASAIALPQPARPHRELDLPVPIAPPLVALKVLIAEDNQVNQRIALAMLKRLGHRAVLVPNGQAAVEQTERERFDVVLMDVQMPEMSGLDAATAIRRRERYARDNDQFIDCREPIANQVSQALGKQAAGFVHRGGAQRQDGQRSRIEHRTAMMGRGCNDGSCFATQNQEGPGCNQEGRAAGCGVLYRCGKRMAERASPPRGAEFEPAATSMRGIDAAVAGLGPETASAGASVPPGVDQACR